MSPKNMWKICSKKKVIFAVRSKFWFRTGYLREYIISYRIEEEEKKNEQKTGSFNDS